MQHCNDLYPFFTPYNRILLILICICQSLPWLKILVFTVAKAISCHRTKSELFSFVTKQSSSCSSSFLLKYVLSLHIFFLLIFNKLHCILKEDLFHSRKLLFSSSKQFNTFYPKEVSFAASAKNICCFMSIYIFFGKSLCLRKA